jgi:hypothetical protein
MHLCRFPLHAVVSSQEFALEIPIPPGLMQAEEPKARGVYLIVLKYFQIMQARVGSRA